MKKKGIIHWTGAYLGVIAGTAIVQIIFQGKIEHIISKLIIVCIGYVVVLAVYLLNLLNESKK